MRALIAQDREAFYSAEIAVREATHYPPFGRLASLLISGADSTPPKLMPEDRGGLPIHDDVRVLGPAEAPLAVVRRAPPLPPAGEVAARLRLSAYLREMARRGA